MVTRLEQGCPEVKSARIICCMGNWLRLSPQKPIVDEVPLCSRVTNVTCTVVPFSPMTALSCTTLTEPLTLDKPAGGRAPRRKTFPQPAKIGINPAAKHKERRCFKGHFLQILMKVYTQVRNMG